MMAKRWLMVVVMVNLVCLVSTGYATLILSVDVPDNVAPQASASAWPGVTLPVTNAIDGAISDAAGPTYKFTNFAGTPASGPVPGDNNTAQYPIIVLNWNQPQTLTQLIAYVQHSSNRASKLVGFSIRTDPGSTDWTTIGYVLNSNFVPVTETGFTDWSSATLTGTWTNVYAVKFTFERYYGKMPGGADYYPPRVGEVLAVIPEPMTAILLALGGIITIRKRD